MSAEAAVRCTTCPRGCLLAPGKAGLCRARKNVGGKVQATSYGRVTSIALDPVEKKPLARWKPGSKVLSLGSYGCNLRCPWCQNYGISQAGQDDVLWREVTPEYVVALAQQLRDEDPRTVGIAYTYNEPLVSWEFVRDCGVLAHEAGLSNVLVSAGCVSQEVVREVAPLIDAANIDLKSFSAQTYESLGGSLECVQSTIRMLDADITLHVSRFFPNWHMRDRGPTAVARVYALADVARRHLAHVFTGNC